MIAFRKGHPSLCRSRFSRKDIRWYGIGPGSTSPDSHSFAYCLHGQSVGDCDLYVMINAYWEDLTFTMQEGAVGQWQRVVDTSWKIPRLLRTGNEIRVSSQTYAAKARSVVVLVRT